MGLQCGIIGLPNAGKSTLFNALTGGHAPVAPYPFSTTDRNVGIASVPDRRLDRLAAIYRPQKITPTTIEYVDVAGLVKGASQGEGLGNEFLGHIREMDALLHVVRCFQDSHVVHVEGEVNPIRDVELVETELILADLETVERRIVKVEGKLKSGDKKALKERECLVKLTEGLEKGQRAKNIPFTLEERESLSECYLLTEKPTLFVANISEKEIAGGCPVPEDLGRFATKRGEEVVAVSGKIEEEIAALPPKEREEMYRELGLEESGVIRVITAAYRLLRLMTFFTVVHEEVRAWTLPERSTALAAAGRVHTDMARGFIRAEVIPFEVLERLGSPDVVKEKGLVRSEGKDYLVRDGDILHFRFQV